MSTDLEDRLTERMQHLADGVPAPDVRPEDDLARGHRRVRVRRTTGVAAAVAVGVIVGGTGYLLRAPSPAVTVVTPAGEGGSAANGSAGKVVSGSRAMTDVKRRHAPWRPDGRLDGFRDAVAQVLDPQGDHLDAKVTNEQSGGNTYLGTKIGWTEGAGMGEIMVGVSAPGAGSDSFSDFDSSGCAAPDAAPCTPIRLPDGTAGTQQRIGGDLAVWYVRPDKQVVMIVESTLFGNNSDVAVDSLPATATQLLEAASDPRMTLKK